MLLRMSDDGEDRLEVQRRDSGGNIWRFSSRVGGVTTVLSDFFNYGPARMELTLAGDRLLLRARHGSGGAVNWPPVFPKGASSLLKPVEGSEGAQGWLQMPPGTPMGHRVGLRGSGSATNPWLDNLAFTRLPS